MKYNEGTTTSLQGNNRYLKNRNLLSFGYWFGKLGDVANTGLLLVLFCKFTFFPLQIAVWFELPDWSGAWNKGLYSYTGMIMGAKSLEAPCASIANRLKSWNYEIKNGAYPLGHYCRCTMYTPRSPLLVLVFHSRKLKLHSGNPVKLCSVKAQVASFLGNINQTII